MQCFGINKWDSGSQQWQLHEYIDFTWMIWYKLMIWKILIIFGGCGNNQVEDLKTFLKFKACWQKQMCLLCGRHLLRHTCHWKWRNVPVSRSWQTVLTEQSHRKEPMSCLFNVCSAVSTPLLRGFFNNYVSTMDKINGFSFKSFMLDVLVIIR